MAEDTCRCRKCLEPCDRCVCDLPEPDYTTSDAKRRGPARTRYQRNRKRKLLADAKCMDCGSPKVTGRTKTRCRRCLNRLAGIQSVGRAVQKILSEPDRRCYHWQAPSPTTCPICQACVKRAVERARNALEHQLATAPAAPGEADDRGRPLPTGTSR